MKGLGSEAGIEAMIVVVEKPWERFPEKFEEYKPLLDFLVEFVARPKGMKKLKKFLKDNSDCSLVDFLSQADVAYALTLLKNNQDRWKQALDIEAMPSDEQLKWKKPLSVPKEERHMHLYRKVKPRFTTREGKRMP